MATGATSGCLYFRTPADQTAREGETRQGLEGPLTCEAGQPTDSEGPGDVEWPTAQGNPAKTGHRAEMQGPAGCPSLQWQWSLDVENVFYGWPVTTEDAVVLPNGNGTRLAPDGPRPSFIAFDPETGERLWTAGEGAVHPWPTVVDGVAYGADGDVPGAFDLEAKRWVWVDDGGHAPSLEPPTVADGRVYQVSGQGRLVAREAVSGERLWTFAAEGVSETELPDDGPTDAYRQGLFEAPPASHEGTVFVGSWDDRLYAIDAATGEERWRFHASDYVDERPRMDAAPAVTADGVFAAHASGGGTFGIDRDTGDLRWQEPQTGSTDFSPVVADGTVYTVGNGPSGGSGVVAIDARSGAVEWRTDLFLNFGSLAVGATDVYVLRSRVVALDRETGEERWRFDPDGSVQDGVVLGGNSMFCTDQDGTTYGLW